MPTTTLDPIIAKLAARRRELKIGAQPLSMRCGFPPTQINMYESGARVPDVRRLRRWAAELGMDLTVAEQ